jgi:hypothetical protein
MNTLTLYLDMDGVLANFEKEFKRENPDKFDRQRFRDAVLKSHIFEKLEMMPDAHVLLDHVAKNRNLKVEILTSMGTFDPFQGNETKKQKLLWLRAHNIHYPANFVRTKQEKANFANENTILIDDSLGCIEPFVLKGGIGILHSDARTSILKLDNAILQIKAMSV